MKPERICGQRSEIGSEGAKKEKWGVVFRSLAQALGSRHIGSNSVANRVTL